MAEIVSLEATLTERYEAQLGEGLDLIADAEYNLGRIATVYSDQLSFDDCLRDYILDERP